MRLTVLGLSHKLPDWQQAGINDYSRRFSRDWPLKLIELTPDKRSGGRTPEQVMADEAVRLRQAIPKGARVIALDEHGANWSTKQLAEQLKLWQIDGREAVFLIGGTDGLDPQLKQDADHRLQLSAMTLPHGMVRVMLVEQLYRAISILNNHPYHRE